MKLTILCAAVAAVVVFASANTASACGHGKKSIGDDGSGSFSTGKINGCDFSKLGLNDAQKATLQAAGEKMKAAFGTKDPDQIKAAMASFRKEMEGMLTDEQRAKLAEFKTQLKGRREGPAKNGSL